MSNMKYQLIRGSDVLRDGIYLELSNAGTTPPQLIAEVFYSDVTHNFFLTCYEENVPLDVIEKLISKAKKSLPPKTME